MNEGHIPVPDCVSDHDPAALARAAAAAGLIDHGDRHAVEAAAHELAAEAIAAGRDPAAAIFVCGVEPASGRVQVVLMPPHCEQSLLHYAFDDLDTGSDLQRAVYRIREGRRRLPAPDPDCCRPRR